MRLADVGLEDVDRKRIDRLTERTTFDRVEAEAIVRFANADPDDRDPGSISAFVSPESGGKRIEDGLTPDECDRIRRNMGKASRPKTIIDAWPDSHPSVIFRHATGRCDHDGDVDAVTSPRIEPDECRDMRLAFQTGDTIKDIRHGFNRSKNAVVKHVFGRCPHTVGVTRSGRRVSESLCGRMRRSYRENDRASIQDIASAFTIAPGTAHRHVSGACGHGDAVEGPVDGNGSSSIEERECDEMRAFYRDGSDVDALADRFDRHATSVRKHVFGRCRHGDAPFTPKRDKVDAERCNSIRRTYRERNGESVASLIDRLSTSKGTFYYHLTGECDHDTETPSVANFKP
jgi:hypothetical protein